LTVLYQGTKWYQDYANQLPHLILYLFVKRTTAIMTTASNEGSGRIVQLAATILEKTTKIDTYLKQSGLADPSSHPNAPPTLRLSPEAELCLEQTLASMDELNMLLLGPLGWLKLQISHIVRVNYQAVGHHYLTYAVRPSRSTCTLSL
jgi:hypothetical protein